MKNKNSIFPHERSFFNKLLRAIILFQINNGMFENHNKFKRGEWLKYNWKAKIMIHTAIKDRKEPMQFEEYIFKGDNVKFTNGDSCSAFWVRRLHFWEWLFGTRKQQCNIHDVILSLPSDNDCINAAKEQVEKLGYEIVKVVNGNEVLPCGNCGTLLKIKAIAIRALEMNLKNDIKDEYERMDNALNEIWEICNNLSIGKSQPSDYPYTLSNFEKGMWVCAKCGEPTPIKVNY